MSNISLFLPPGGRYSGVMFSWLFPDPLAIGSAAPEFRLPDQDGALVTLSALRGKNVVLVFYPADETRGCRKQLCEFRDTNELANNRGILVYGINPGSAKSHSNFRSKQNLPFPLLVDEDQRVASLYRAKGLIVKRTVYLINRDGIIRFAKRGKPGPVEVFNAIDIPQ